MTISTISCGSRCLPIHAPVVVLCLVCAASFCKAQNGIDSSATCKSKVSDTPWSTTLSLVRTRNTLHQCRPHVARVYGPIRSTFEPNQGQVDPRVRFFARANGYNLFLTSSEAVLSLIERQPPQVPHRFYRATERRERQAVTVGALRMKLDGANPATISAGLGLTSMHVNYFLGKDTRKWHSNIPTYERVAYRQVYPGVDLIYSMPSRSLEYDFIVAPGANPEVIRLSFTGARKISIDRSGNLILRTAKGTIRHRRPNVFQQLEDVTRSVPVTFRLTGKHQVAFRVGDYDKTRPLVIDPIVVRSSFLGGSGTDQAFGVATDTNGTTYVTGSTNSTDFPSSDSTEPVGGFDIFAGRLDGAMPSYITVIGGTGDDAGYSAAADPMGNLYITGATNSTDFPTTPGAPIMTLPPGVHGFALKLSPSGALGYSTLLGGSGRDEGSGIAVDSAGNAYVAGITNSTDYPSTSGAFQPTYNGGPDDGFVTKLDSTGTVFPYSTFLGGTGDDAASAIAVDGTGNAYVTGDTNSPNFPIFNSSQPFFGGGAADAFVAALNSAGSGPIFSTYLGGLGLDSGAAITVGPGGIFVAGITDSPNFPTTSGAFQKSLAGGADGFIQRNALSGERIYSTLLGGSGDDFLFGVGVDGMGNVSVAGSTSSLNYPISPDAFQTMFAGGPEDGSFSILNASGSALMYSSYLGGSGDDAITALNVDSNGNSSFAGFSSSADFPTLNAFQPMNGGGNYDGVVGVIAGGCKFSPGTCTPCNDEGCRQAMFQTCQDLGCPTPVIGPVQPDGSCRIFCQQQ